MHFTCKCGKINWVSIGFTARIVDKKTLEEYYRDEGFE